MERLFIYLTDLSSGASYAIVFGILVACGLGFTLPEDIPLVASGYLVWDGTMNWGPALAVTLLGVGIGDSILFFIGRKLGMRILEPGANKRSVFPPERIRRTRSVFSAFRSRNRAPSNTIATSAIIASGMGLPVSRLIIAAASARRRYNSRRMYRTEFARSRTERLDHAFDAARAAWTFALMSAAGVEIKSDAVRVVSGCVNVVKLSLRRPIR